MLNNYLQELIHIWGEDAYKMFVLKIGVCSYPILDAKNMGVNTPFAICVENESIARAVLHELSGFGSSEVISLGLTKREFEGRLAEVKYELVPILCDRICQNNYVNLDIIQNAFTSKTLKKKKFSGLPIIIFYGAVPLELADYLSGKCIISGKRIINEAANSNETVWCIMRSLLDNVPVFEYKMVNLCEGDNDIPFLRGAAEVCKVLVEQDRTISNKMSLNLIEGIEAAVDSLEEEWAFVGDYSDWLDLLRDSILKRAKNIIRIVDRNAVSYSDEVFLDRYTMFDRKYYYFTTQFFTEMCNKIPNIGEMELKRAMRDAGILVGEGKRRDYYTVKVPIKLKSGEVKIEKRRLRIVREWLDLPARPTWKEQIEENNRRIRQDE